MKDNFYFIALVPPAELSEEIVSIQKDFSERFNSKASLKVMPHITLKAPFSIPEIGHQIVVEWFENMVVEIPAFNLKLSDFGAFHNPRQPVIYIKPIKNKQLMELQENIMFKFQETFPDIPVMSLETSYSPHLTIAYRDLQPDFFEISWEEFKEKPFKAAFKANSFNLLQHDGRCWNIIGTHNLL